MKIGTRRTARLLAAAAAVALGVAVLPDARAAISTQAFCANVPQGQSGFTDLSAAGPHQRNVECLRATGITTGVTATTYNPGGIVSRAQMANFIARMIDKANELDAPGGADIPDLPTAQASPDAFTDDEQSPEAEPNINRLAAAGVVRGTGGSNFSPTAQVTRQQMASFIAQALAFVRSGALPDGADAFGDDETSTHEANINRLANADIVDGTGPGTFNPAGLVSRAQMASFIVQGLADLHADGFISAVDSPSNATLNVAPTTSAVVQTTSPDSAADDRTYTASGLAAGTYRVQLLACASVINDGGQYSFADANNDNLADPGTNTAAAITSVNGAAPSTTAPNTPQTQGGLQPVSGTITFVLDAEAQGCVIPVLYTDGGASPFLELDANDRPTEAFGVGGQFVVVPPEAAIGSQGGNVEITTVDISNDLFTGDTTANDVGPEPGTDDRTYFYDANDTYKFQGVAISMSQFESAINANDIVTVNYNPDPAGVSIFDLVTDQPPTAPAAPTASVQNLDGEAKANDVQVTFTPPAANSAGTSYSLLRSTVDDGPDNSCGTPDDTAGAFSVVGGATQARGAGGTVTFTDNDVADGCYLYRVRATNPVSATTADSANSNGALVPPPPDTTGPTAQDTELTSSQGTASDLDTGDVLKVCFNEVIADVTDADAELLRITDADGTVVSLTNGTNATFARNAAADPDTSPGFPATSCPANRQLSVTVTAAPTVETAGTAAGLQIGTGPQQANITNAGDVEDLAGNLWDPAGDADVGIAAEATPEPS